MPYRIVPVGDKLVLMIEPELRQPHATDEAVYIRAYESNAGYYDFGVDQANANEGFRETTFGGNSHE